MAYEQTSRIHLKWWYFLLRCKRFIIAALVLVHLPLATSFLDSGTWQEWVLLVSALIAFVTYGSLLPTRFRYDMLRWPLDVVCASLMVYVTGGVGSALYLLYLFPLLLAGRWYGWRASLPVTLSVFVCYPFSCWIASRHALSMREVTLISYRLVFFLLVAMVSVDTWMRERRRKRLLAEIVPPLLVETGESSLYARIAKAAREVTSADVATLFLVSRDGKYLEPRGSSGQGVVESLAETPIDKGVVGRCVREHTTIVVRNVPKYRLENDYIDHLKGAKSEICTPIVFEGSVKGVLCVESLVRECLLEDEPELLESLAALAAIAVERLYGSEYRTVLDVCKTILRTHKREGPIRAIVEAAMTLPKVNWVDIRLVDEDETDGCLRFVDGCCGPGFESGPPDRTDTLDPNDSIGAWVVVNKKPYLCNDMDQQDDPRAKPVFQNEVGSYLCVPLAVGDKVLGALGVASRDKEAFNEAHLRRLVLLGELAALGIDAEAHRHVEQTLAGLGTGLSIASKPADWDDRVKRKNAGDPDWDKDLDLKIVEANQQQREWFKSKGDPVGKICYKFYNSEAQDRPCANCPVCDALIDGEPHVAWAPSLGKTKGRCVHFLLFAKAVGGNGSPEGAVETVVDVNDLFETRYLAAELIGKPNRREIYDVAVEAMGRILQADRAVVLGRENESDPLTIEHSYECRPDNETEIALARRGGPSEEELIRDYLQNRPRQFFAAPALLPEDLVLDTEVTEELLALVRRKGGIPACVDLRRGVCWPSWIERIAAASESRRGLLVPFFGPEDKLLGAVLLFDRADLGPYTLLERTGCYIGGRLVGAAIQNTLVHRLARIDRERRVYVAGLAHFLQGHAHSITGKLEYMQDLLNDLTDGAEGEARSELDTTCQGIGDGVNLLAGKTKDMLLFASEAFAAGRGAVLSGPHDLSDMVARVVEAYRSMAQGRSMSFRFQGIEAGYDTWYDSTTMELAVGNFLENAIKYGTPGTEVEVSLSYDEAASLFHIVVTGRGRQVGDDVKARMFDKFYRGDPSGGMDGTGMGLGLWVTSEVIAQHGGEINFSSEPAVAPSGHDDSEPLFVNEFRITLPRVLNRRGKDGADGPVPV